jgi:hypothetical protein
MTPDLQAALETVREGLLVYEPHGDTIGDALVALALIEQRLEELERERDEWKYAASAYAPGTLTPPDCWGLRQRAEKAEARIAELETRLAAEVDVAVRLSKDRQDAERERDELQLTLPGI